ncbi:MAG: radical SAM protein [bacterium]|nr:radical SAM protein [bacterium]
MSETNKKVALISLYRDDTSGNPPLGSLYLATALKKNGFIPKIIFKSESQIGQIESEIENFKPALIGMSVFTGYLNKRYVDLSRQLKDKGYLIVWGNAHASLLPEQVLRESAIDFVVIGEGEETLLELAKNLGNKDNYKNITGLGFKGENGQIVVNPRRNFGDMDEYLIDWSLVDIEDYIVPYFSGKYKRTLMVVTSRGCPFNCQFCYNQVFNNRRWRAHSAEKLIANLKPVIAKHKIDAIRFLDDNFFVNKERAFAIARGLGLPYWAESRVEFVDEKFVVNLKETKCQEIMFGFESGSDRILKEVVKKGITVADTIRAVTLLKNSGIMASGSIIFGLPTETEEEYKATMKLIIKLSEINNNLAFTCGWFLPFPGTGLYEVAKTLGFKPPEKIEDWDIFDRWRNDYEMAWVKWDYRQAVKYSRQVVHLLALAHKRNIPFLKTILKKRIEQANYFFPLDIYLFAKLRNIYLFSGQKNFITRLIRRVITYIIKLKQIK